jgi:hypothetical protein
LVGPSVFLRLSRFPTHRLFDWPTTGQIIDVNPAKAVRAAKHVVKKCKTPIVKADEARELLDGIPLKNRPGAERH